MNLKEVDIIDTNFSHSNYSTDFQSSNYIKWIRGRNFTSDDTIIVTDFSMMNSINFNVNRIAWLIEPRAICPSTYSWVEENYNKFINVLTYDKQLLESIPNSIFYPHSGCWIKPEDQKIYSKTKLLSIISSNKRQTKGHNLRHDIIHFLIDNQIKTEILGRGYKPIDYKLVGLKEFAFQIVVENNRSDYYFTEKIIDCFVTGTVPIYWGCPSIGDYFNLNGIIVFNDLNDLLLELNALSFDRYMSMNSAIEENFIKAKEFLIAEDWIYKNTNIFK